MSVASISAATRLFSSAVIKELATRGHSNLFARLYAQSEIRPRSEQSTVGDAFEDAFNTIKRVGSRDEYVYKAALTHKVLLGTHSLRSASMLTEFRAGDCKADMVILNGTATVYEIKSERDSLCRLERQLEQYRKVFAKVNVIAADSHISKIERMAPADVGLLCLTPRFQIKTIRPATDNANRICPSTLFESLRLAEAKSVIKAMGLETPTLPNTLMHGELKRIFSKLDPLSLHLHSVTVLKESRNLAPLDTLVDALPLSLHAAALTVPIPRKAHALLVEAINAPIRRAMEWA